MGFGLVIGFILNFNTRLVTTCNYNTITDLHSLQNTVTATHAKSLQSAFNSRFPVMDLNNGESSAFVLMLLLSGEYPTTH
jgi:hypothetical protein